jgi:hypothetical protein
MFRATYSQCDLEATGSETYAALKPQHTPYFAPQRLPTELIQTRLGRKAFEL